MWWLITYTAQNGYTATELFHKPLEVALALIRENELDEQLPYSATILNVVGLSEAQALYLLSSGFDENDY